MRTLPRSLLAGLALALAACGGDDDDDGGGGGAVDANPEVPSEYMERCSTSPDNCVEPEMCFVFNMKGPICTHACDTADECPAPSTGCNNMGICKAP